MMKTILSLFTIYQLSSSNRRLLQPLFIPVQPQTFPNPNVIPNIPPNSPNPPQTPALIPNNLGYYNQVCTEPQSDFQCQSIAPPGITLSDGGTKKIECGVDYSCCLCRSIWCGTPLQPNCDEITVNGDYGAFAVQDINIYGPPDQGAFLKCGGSFSCAHTIINGVNMNTIGCAADNSCSGAIMSLENSAGLVCGQQGCVGAKFTMNSNNKGDISCAGPQSCLNANIEIQGIRNVGCNGNSACKGATIKVTNPLNGFTLICNGDLACDHLKLLLYIPEPIGIECPIGPLFADYVDWKGITCGSPEACKGMELTVVNNGCAPVRIEDLECSPNQACVGAVFDLEAGTGPFAQWVELTNCKCSAISCQQATGIDRCYNNLRQMTCPDSTSCVGLQETITNPANGFILNCPATQSCMGLALDVVVSGGSGNLVQYMLGLNCGGIQGCYGATVRFVNTQINHNGNSVIINVQSVQCPNAQSCQGLTIITGPNVVIGQVICGDVTGDECTDCVIKEFQTDIGTSCNPTQPQRQSIPGIFTPPI